MLSGMDLLGARHPSLTALSFVDCCANIYWMERDVWFSGLSSGCPDRTIGPLLLSHTDVWLTR